MHHRHHNLIIRRPRFSLSLFSLCSHSSITFSRLCNHTHNHNNMFSRYARRAPAPCSLFKIFLPFPLLLLSSDHSKKEGERERAKRREEKKSVCKLLKSFMNERIEAKKGKTRCSRAHTHTLTRRLPFFSLLFLFVAPIYFSNCACPEFRFCLNLLIVASRRCRLIYNGDRLECVRVHAGRRSTRFSLSHLKTSCSVCVSLIACHPSPSFLRGPLLFCSNDEQQRGSSFVSYNVASVRLCFAFRSETVSNKSIGSSEEQQQ